jgi:hypothetical protein
MTLTQDILQAAGKGAAGLDEAERLALLRASEKLMVSLETPVEKFMRHFFVSPTSRTYMVESVRYGQLITSVRTFTTPSQSD